MDEEAKLRWPRWLQWLLAAYIALVAVQSLATSGMELAQAVGAAPASESWGYLSRSIGSDVPAGYVKIDSVAPGKLMDREGVKAGDLIRFADPLTLQFMWLPGETLRFEVLRDGRHEPHVVVVRERDWSAGLQATRAIRATGALVSAVMLVLALLVLWRRWGEPVAMCLGAILLPFGTPARTMLALSHAEAYRWAIAWLVPLCFAGIYLVLPLVLLLSGAAASARQWRLVGIVTPLCVVADYLNSTSQILLLPLPLIGNPTRLIGSAIALAYGLALALLWHNRARIDAARMNRIRILGAAFALLAVGVLTTIAFWLGMLGEAWWAPINWVRHFTTLTAALLITYAIIRQGLFDFTFAVNRTLVFSAVSAIMLCAFGLAEWAAHHTLPAEWTEASELTSAGVALALYLTFHRVRDFVEHHVERLFFHSWQANEEKLRAIVARAGHFEREAPLAGRAVAELVRFSGGAASAFYLREEGEDYGLAAGEGAASVDGDDAALVAARAGRGSVRAGEAGSALATDLVLPIRDHGEVAGFFTLTAKPHSLGYRPDEIELLEWAGQQVGQALLSARARATRARARELELRLREVEGVIARLAPAAG